MRSRAVALACAVALCVLAKPGQVALGGGDNGHGGQRFRDLPHVLALPELEDAALLARAWHYRAIVSNVPWLADRMPLVIDPGPICRVNPLIAKPGSEVFAGLFRDYDVVLVLQHEPDYRRDLPTVHSFPSFRKELRTFSDAAVLCTDFGQPLGVFTQPAAALTDAQAHRLADEIMAVASGNVKCAPGG